MSPLITSQASADDSNASTPTTQAPELAQPPTVSIDLGFLLDRRNYHQVSVEDVSPAFLESKHKPPLGASMTDLIEHGHFRRAAEAALDELLQCSRNDASRILELLYTRLACLMVASMPDLAADEAVALTDFLHRNAQGAKDVLPMIPWELRLLLVRLQSIVAQDGGRRGIMALYALSAEVRSHLKEARPSQDEIAISTWSARLTDLGLRVADTLVEMGELETATRHLDTLTAADADEIHTRKTLLRIRVGDVAAAKKSVPGIADGTRKDMLNALLKTADGNVDEATSVWKSLADAHPDDQLLAQNLAVSLLYTGRIAEARSVFESLVRDSPAFFALLFNLSTVYELCTERALERKGGLSEHLASKTPQAASGGWERNVTDFKL